MEQRTTGTIVETDADRARVRCGAGDSPDQDVVEVANPEGLTVGTAVALAVAPGDQARVAAVVLGLPLTGAVLGAGAGAARAGDGGAVAGLFAGGLLGAVLSAVLGRSLPVRLEARPPRVLAAPG